MVNLLEVFIIAVVGIIDFFTPETRLGIWGTVAVLAGAGCVYTCRKKISTGYASMRAGRMATWSRIRYGTVPIAKVPELEHCWDALIEYSAIPAEKVISAAEIAASNAALAPLYAACKVLDDQQIPRPEVDKGIVLSGSAEWIEFLARVLAVQHDLEDARRIYQHMT